MLPKKLSLTNTNRQIIVEMNKVPPTHPLYYKLLSEFSYYNASYAGGARFKDAIDSQGEPVFIPHEHESPQAVKRRKKMSVYHNYVKAIVDRLVGYVHESAITRSEAEVFKAWENEIDLSLKMREGSQKASVLGRWHWIIDSTKTEDILTESQAQEAGVTITLADLPPERVIDWNKNFTEMLVIHEDPAYEFGLVIHWKPLTYIKYGLDKTGRIANSSGEIIHGYPRIPIVTMWGLNPDCDPSSSVVGDIVEACRILYNLDSILREELSRQTFTKWVLWGVDPEKLAQSEKVLGSRNVTAINVKASDGRLDRMASDSSQAESLRATMESDVREIYRMIGLRMPEVEVGPESGRALKVRFVETALLAAKLAKNAEIAESQIIDLYNSATGQDIEHPEYPEITDFDEASLTEDLKATLDIITNDLPDIVKSEKVKQYIRKDFARLDAEERDAMLKATEEKYLEPEMDEEGMLELPEEEDEDDIGAEK